MALCDITCFNDKYRLFIQFGDNSLYNEFHIDKLSKLQLLIKYAFTDKKIYTLKINVKNCSSAFAEINKILFENEIILDCLKNIREIFLVSDLGTCIFLENLCLHCKNIKYISIGPIVLEYNEICKIIKKFYIDYTINICSGYGNGWLFKEDKKRIRLLELFYDDFPNVYFSDSEMFFDIIESRAYDDKILWSDTINDYNKLLITYSHFLRYCMLEQVFDFVFKK
jgi:hypothetical protein